MHCKVSQCNESCSTEPSSENEAAVEEGTKQPECSLQGATRQQVHLNLISIGSIANIIILSIWGLGMGLKQNPVSEHLQTLDSDLIFMTQPYHQ